MSGRASHHTHQKSLPRFNAKQKGSLSLKLITLRNAMTEFICDGWQPGGSQTMATLLQKMHYGDALWSRNLWRLERLQLNTGYPHYRLYHRSHVFGVVRVNAEPHWDTAVCAMAAYITGLGFTEKNSYLEYSGAKTALTASTEYLPQLFHVRYVPDGSRRKNQTEVVRRGW